MDSDSSPKTWHFVPCLPEWSCVENSSQHEENQSFMETLSILIDMLENPKRNLDFSVHREEEDRWILTDSDGTTNTAEHSNAFRICFRFHEGHSNAILKPVTIDMLLG
jgi:hypothetical protein